MNDEHAISIDGRALSLTVERRDRPWGHALDVSVVEAGGATRAKIVLACHPEFGGFDECQAMSTEELIDIVQRRLNAAAIAASCHAFERGITTVFVLNSPDEARDLGGAG